MYADRETRSGIDPRSLGIAVALNGAIVAAALLTQTSYLIRPPAPPLKTYNVPLQPPPEPLPPKPVEHQQARQSTYAPHPIVDLPMPQNPVLTSTVIVPLPLPSADPGPIVVPDASPTPMLVTVAPQIDPAHRADLQPAYPAAELRAEHEGVVMVRVLVGVDGRVRQVERVGATSDAFFRATQEQALRRWRFRPATRGSVPVEAWQTVTIRFVIPR